MDPTSNNKGCITITHGVISRLETKRAPRFLLGLGHGARFYIRVRISCYLVNIRILISVDIIFNNIPMKTKKYSFMRISFGNKNPARTRVSYISISKTDPCTVDRL